MGLLLTVIDLIYWFFWIMILVRIIFSFVLLIPYHHSARRIVEALMPLFLFAERVTEPLLAPIRRFLPPMQGLDFSPLIALLLLGFLRRIFYNLLL